MHGTNKGHKFAKGKAKMNFLFDYGSLTKVCSFDTLTLAINRVPPSQIRMESRIRSPVAKSSPPPLCRYLIRLLTQGGTDVCQRVTSFQHIRLVLLGFLWFTTHLGWVPDPLGWFSFALRCLVPGCHMSAPHLPGVPGLCPVLKFYGGMK